jgi:hypothetical protein
MSKGTNFKIVSVENPETEESIEIYVRYKWYYDPGVWTLSNGDPGYPEESEIDIAEYHISEAPNEPIPDWIDEGMIEEAIWEAGDVFETDY